MNNRKSQIANRKSSIQAYLHVHQRLIDQALGRWLPKVTARPGILHQAMRYSIFSGGKRIRPILTLASCEAVGGRVQEGLRAACAIELIHTYSLIHDDLPALDNDDLRRGRPTCHRRFGEAVALLAGDALLTLGFQWLADPSLPQGQLMIGEVAGAVGAQGMIGGQVVDVLPHKFDQPTLRYIATHKTGSLIACAVKVGALAGQASRRMVTQLGQYGHAVGLAFQLVDDLLDRDGYVQVYGQDHTRKEAIRLIRSAKEVLAPLGPRGIMLRRLADFIVKRES